MRRFLNPAGPSEGKREQRRPNEKMDTRDAGSSNADCISCPSSMAEADETKAAGTVPPDNSNNNNDNSHSVLCQAVAALQLLGSEPEDHLIAAARVSELCALKKLEVCQQELVQMQRMWNLDSEMQRWTIVSLREEVSELRQELDYQRRRGTVQRYGRDGSTAARTSFASSVSEISSLSRPNFRRDDERGSAADEGCSMATSAEASCVQIDAAADHSFGQLSGACAGVDELRERVEHYRRLLHDANRDRDELRAELTRMARRLHDDRRAFSQRISLLLREKEAVSRDHLVTLRRLEETCGLLVAARAAERAALQLPAAASPLSPSAGPPGGCPQCDHPFLCGEALRGAADLLAERRRSSTLEDEVCALECRAERDARNVEGLRRVIERLIDEVGGHTRDCRAANRDAIGCLREMSLLFAEDADGEEDSSDAENSISINFSGVGNIEDCGKSDGGATPPCVGSQHCDVQHNRHAQLTK